MQNMKPLKITAHLVDGFVSSDKWSPSIDGIIAFSLIREALGDEEFAIQCGSVIKSSDVVALPLEKISHGEFRWYACSFPAFETNSKTVKHFHRRFDQHHSDKLDLGGKSGKILTAAGPYKNYRRKIEKINAREITWHVIGEEHTISAALDSITHVGSKIAQGYGEVRRWSVSQGDAELARRYRALPKPYADIHGVSGTLMQWGISPPARDNSTLCVMPS